MRHRGPKYAAVPTVVAGRRFASKAEARHYEQLLLRQKAGDIFDLRCQPRYPLTTVNRDGWPVAITIGPRKVVYVADFSYTDRAGTVHVIDVKGFDTPMGKLKRAIFEANYDTKVELIHERQRQPAGRGAGATRARQAGIHRSARRPA
jgi:Protein of unknown function (DUF1064)